MLKLRYFRQMRFDLRELSGSLGDLGLFIPLVVAVCVTTDMNLGVILIAAGIMNIATGVLFNQPIPVQPMKAIAAVAIAEGLTTEQIAASGLLMGVILLLLHHSGMLHWIVKRIPKVLIRGVQVGVGLKLIMLAVQWFTDLNWSLGQTAQDLGIELPGVSMGILGLLVFIILIMTIRKAFPTLLIFFVTGLVVVYINHDLSTQQAVFAEESLFKLVIPTVNDFSHSFWYAVIPQLPLTLLNSVIAICALSADYFPKRPISTGKMASSVAWMNIICSPFGALPMCHGASGLAAQYQFGARTGGSVIMLGLVKVAVGLFLGSYLMLAMSAYPKFVLAPLLIIAGLALCKSAWLDRAVLNLPVLAVTVFGIVAVNTLVGFIAGLCLFLLIDRFAKSPTN